MTGRIVELNSYELNQIMRKYPGGLREMEDRAAAAKRIIGGYVQGLISSGTEEARRFLENDAIEALDDQYALFALRRRLVDLDLDDDDEVMWMQATELNQLDRRADTLFKEYSRLKQLREQERSQRIENETRSSSARYIARPRRPSETRPRKHNINE